VTAGDRVNLSTLLLAWLTLVGCQQSVSQEGLARLAEAQQQFETGNYTTAEQALSRFLRKRRGPGDAAAAHYLRGLCYRQMQPPRNDLAERDFAAAVENAPDQEVRQLAQAAWGHVRFENHDYSGAVEHYTAALAGPAAQNSGIDAVLYRLGVSLQNLGDWAEADGYLSRCLGEFPESPYAPAAQRRFGARMFRVQLGAFADLDRAMQRVEQLRRTGVAADWSAQRSSGAMTYVVRSGRYDNLKQAQRAQAALLAVQPDAFVTVDR